MQWRLNGFCSEALLRPPILVGTLAEMLHYPVYHLGYLLLGIHVAHGIHLADHYRAQLVLRYPFLVELVEVGEVFGLHPLLKGPIAPTYAPKQHIYGGTEVDEQVGRFHHAMHLQEEILVAVILLGQHQPHIPEILGEYVDVFVERAILHHVLLAQPDFLELFDTAVEEGDLHGEPPALHIGIEELGEGIFLRLLDARLPTESLGEFTGEPGFPR